MQKTESKKNWIITSNAFHRLLEWLDEGADSDGQEYLEMRARMVAFFDRKNCLLPEDLADETLNRVARRLQETDEITTETPAKYYNITARFVFLESLRGNENKNVSLDELSQNKGLRSAESQENEEKESKEKKLNCLEQSTVKLENINRDLIVRYYFGEERIKIENRRALAESLKISVNALSIRACRIRDKLESCVKSCVDAPG